MAARLRSCRRAFLISAALLVAVAMVVAAGVIPRVKADTYSGAEPERAVRAFWANVVIGLLMAAILGFTAARISGRRRLSTALLTVGAVVVLLLALAFTDAALAFRGHGPAMHTTTVLCFVCAAADLLAAMMIGVTAFLLPKRV